MTTVDLDAPEHAICSAALRQRNDDLLRATKRAEKAEERVKDLEAQLVPYVAGEDALIAQRDQLRARVTELEACLRKFKRDDEWTFDVGHTERSVEAAALLGESTDSVSKDDSRYEPDRSARCNAVRTYGDSMNVCNRTKGHPDEHERWSYTGIRIDVWPAENAHAPSEGIPRCAHQPQCTTEEQHLGRMVRAGEPCSSDAVPGPDERVHKDDGKLISAHRLGGVECGQGACYAGACNVHRSSEAVTAFCDETGCPFKVTYGSTKCAPHTGFNRPDSNEAVTVPASLDSLEAAWMPDALAASWPAERIRLMRIETAARVLWKNYRLPNRDAAAEELFERITEAENERDEDQRVDKAVAKGRRCHACDQHREEVGDGFNTMPLCSSCLKAWRMGDRHGREARDLEDPPKWPEMPAWSKDADGDKRLREEEQIEAVHPAIADKPRHDLYAEAMRLVGAKHSKGGLVEMVNWLLHRLEESKVQSVTRGCEVRTDYPTVTEVIAMIDSRIDALNATRSLAGDERELDEHDAQLAVLGDLADAIGKRWPGTDPCSAKAVDK